MTLQKLVCLIVLCVLSITHTVAQSSKGLPSLKNFSPRDYKATPQNLGVTQTPDGAFYFANAAGILEYNGTKWQLIKIPGNIAVTCVYAANNNLIYVGGHNEFGYLEKQNTGLFKYISLVPASKKQTDNKIRSINEVNGFVLFQTRHGFYKLKNKKLSFVEAPAPLHLAHYTNQLAYVLAKDHGLIQFDGKEFKPVENGSIFTSTIFGVVKIEHKLIVVTDAEIFVSDNHQPFEPVPVNFTNFNSVKLLDNKLLSFGLFGDGLIITDLNFNIIHQLNIDNGLQDGTVNDQFLDKEKNLWLALNRGITRIEAFSPVTSFGFDQGIKSSIESVIEFKNEIYISTYNGVLYFDKSTKKFESVANIKVDCYGLNTFALNGDTALYCAVNNGIYKIVNHSAQKVIDCIPYNFGQSKYYQNRMFICNDDGFKSYSNIGGVWRKEDIDYKIDWPVLSYCEQNDKTVWVSDLNEGVYKITIQPSSTDRVKLDRFENNKLPSGFVFVYKYQNKVLFGTSDGIYELDEKKQTFFRSTLNPPFKDKFAIHRMASDGRGNLWVSVFYEKKTEYDVCYYDGKNWIYHPFQKSSNDIIQCIGFDQQYAYFGSASGLYCYDYTNYVNYTLPFQSYISSFKASGEFQPVQFKEDDSPVLPYALNDLTFEFYTDSYTEETANNYSYYLDGYSKKWSDWTTDNQAFFTNLHEGDYVLKVKTQNIFGNISQPASLHFSILAPWYRKWWAYVLYIAALGVFIYGAISYSTRKLKAIIKEHTAEIVEQKEEIEKQKVVLEVKNRDILDSIKYAKRIQETIIPSEQTLQDHITENMFVFYKPKDIVSGDFYWMSKVDDLVLVAVVDCTGHGVPGALVSIVGNNGLNRAVNEFHLRKPSDILDKLAILTEEAFKQQGKEDLRDGMDITLISINKSKQEIQFAGANNPLWIIRNGSEFEEIKANKQPIGKFEARQPFKNHVFTYQPGDAVFMFTDGYADQFGGPGGKKFKYKQLQDIILLNNQLKYPFLKSLLSQTFEDWRADYEQLDDVCLMGIKL